MEISYWACFKKTVFYASSPRYPFLIFQGPLCHNFTVYLKMKHFSVDVSVLVKDATSGGGLANASVEFTLGDFMLTGNTDEEGWAVFTLR